MQYKFIPAVEHLLLIPEKSVVDDDRRLWSVGVIEDDGTGVQGRHG